MLRPKLGDLVLTRRPMALQVGAAVSALLFLGTSGFGGFESHPSSPHQQHSADIVAMQLNGASKAEAGLHTGPDDAPSVATHHGGHRPEVSGEGQADSLDHESTGHPHHDSSNECTCIGVCAGGAAPALEDTDPLVSPAPAERIWTVPRPVPLIGDDPTHYLAPLPNAPPLRA